MSVATTVTTHGSDGGHHLPRAVKLRQFRQMALMLLVSDIVFVAGLFFAYLYLRALNVNHMWLPASVHPPSALDGWVVAGLMIASSIAYRWADLGGRAGQSSRLGVGLSVAMVLVAVDLGVQIHQLAAASFTTGDGAFASSFYALGGYHAVHLALLLLIGAGVCIRAARGLYRKGEYNEVSLLGYWWYWVTVAAVGMAILPH